MKPTDPRGVLIELMDKPVHINYITIKKGRARGGHKHEYVEKFFVVSGKGYYTEVGREYSVPIQESQVIVTKPNIAHAIVASETKLELLEVRNGGIKFKAEPDIQLRAWVDYINSLPDIKYTKKSTIMGRRK